MSCLDLSLQKLDAEVLADAGLVAVYVGMHTATRIAVRGPAAHPAARPEGAPVRLRALRPHERGAAARTGRGHGARRRGGAGAPFPLPETPDQRKSEEPERAGDQPGQDHVRGAGPQRPAEALALRPPGAARRIDPHRRIRRGQPGLQASLPALPRGSGVPGQVPHRSGRHGARGHSPAGERRRHPHFLRRPGLLQRAHPWPAARARLARSVSRRHVRRHHQDPAPHRSRERCCPSCDAAGACSSPPRWKRWTTSILRHLDKNHTSRDFDRAVALTRAAGIALAPTFVAFTPWTTLEGYLALLERLRGARARGERAAGAAQHPAARSRRLVAAEAARLQGEAPRLRSRRSSAIPGCIPIRGWIACSRTCRRKSPAASSKRFARREMFAAVWRMAHEAAARPVSELPANLGAPIPRLSEPWYCCAEPTEQQLQSF